MELERRFTEYLIIYLTTTTYKESPQVSGIRSRRWWGDSDWARGVGGARAPPRSGRQTWRTCPRRSTGSPPASCSRSGWSARGRTALSWPDRAGPAPPHLQSGHRSVSFWSCKTEILLERSQTNNSNIVYLFSFLSLSFPFSPNTLNLSNLCLHFTYVPVLHWRVMSGNEIKCFDLKYRNFPYSVSLQIINLSKQPSLTLTEEWAPSEYWN